jgi:hypothetical protein
MGSFNQVCILSGIPITYRDPVRAILVTEHPRATLGTAARGYSSKYIPRTFPIRGTYNDYGSLENVPDDVFKRLWVKGLQDDLIELSQGANPRDEAVTKDLDFDDLWVALLQERLLVPGHRSIKPDRSKGPRPLEEVDHPVSKHAIRNVRVQVAMIREDVWQAIMATPFQASPFYKLPGTLEELRWAVRGYWDECSIRLREAVRFDESMTTNERIEHLVRGSDLFSVRDNIRESRLEESSGTSPLSYFLQDACVSGLGSQWLMALEGAVKPEELSDFFLGVAEMLWFEWVNSYRSRDSLWKPSYAGGQDIPWDDHLRFHKDMVRILEELIAKDKEEYEESCTP